ncbi:kinase-like domain [Ceratocystis lukuohia]|uniref:non-specific serine/threonine protein kinase n=1 Tax=Ceratocystis lukuohia TaxID=2019550 RepID=A0ABR4MKX3_9PEZI
MTNQSLSKIIENHPIGKGLDAFRASFNSICEDESILCSPDALDQLDLRDRQTLVMNLLVAVQTLTSSRFLPSKTGHDSLQTDLIRLTSAVASTDFNFDRVKPLLKSVLADETDDTLLWDQVYQAVTEPTPPPRLVASSIQQTPWLHNTSSFANSSEHRKYVDDVLKAELGSIYVGLCKFHQTYFGNVAGLETASETFFKQCQEGSNPLFDEGWSGWPKDAEQDDVLSWFADFTEKLSIFAEGSKSTSTRQRRPLAKPNEPIDGSIGKRKMDVGFVNVPAARKDSRCHWSQILVPGELKSNRSADKASESWLDLGRYAREVLAAQDTRRFVLGFTICGSLMRVWAFDRLGGIASEQFDLNEDGLRFVYTILGFLSMNDEQLGFDPTIITTTNKERFVEVNRNGSTERIIIDKVMQRAPCIAGRATTCWRAHLEGRPDLPLVIKDSWQYPEHNEEGELLCEATTNDVVNVARYYHHETVQIHGADDDIQSNVRGGLDVTRASNYCLEHPMLPSSSTAGAPRKGRSISAAGTKRSSSHTGAPLPPTKRSCSTSLTKAGSQALLNRIHRRVIVRDYGKSIYKASSRSALLAGFEGCIQGHESLYKAGFLHRDISINNLMINENDDNPSWPSFLIDLDHSIKEQREGSSGAKGKTGTKAFMAIGVLLGEQHSFMHDLESFFWVLFWICIHYNTPNESRVVPEFDKWNYVQMGDLATYKKGVIDDERDFRQIAEVNFTPYYHPFIPLVNRLRRIVFPNGRRWVREDKGLYTRMREILLEAGNDPDVLADE